MNLMKDQKCVHPESRVGAAQKLATAAPVIA